MSLYRPSRKPRNAAEGEAAVSDDVPLSTSGNGELTDASSKTVTPPPVENTANIVNPDLTVTEIKKGARPGDVYVRRHEPHRRLFRRVGPGHFEATEEASQSPSRPQVIYRKLKAIFIGRPLESAQEIHERLSKVKALAVFSSDAISSVAYATGEIMFVLMIAGTAALTLTIPISFVIAMLLFIVAFSYRQTIFAYPNGGGSYIVSLENLGTKAGLVAGAALLIDYTLTVAVSISSGTDAITSAFPVLRPYAVEIALGFVGLMTVVNLRGVTESGSIFAVPTYTFIVMLGGVIALGLVGALLGWYQPPANPAAHPVIEPLNLFLILTAFSTGAVAMSGTEAISNGVPAFKPPESKNAARTLTVMGTILAVFFVSVSLLAIFFKTDPGSSETIISQLGRAVYGDSILYYIFQFATMGILVVAANTAFAGFPRLASILARDNFMPHQFSFRGDRLAFSVGIAALGIVAGLLILIFQGDVHGLIPLYAIGVFLAFTLSQTGMVIHWRKLRTAGWKRSAVINGIGAVATALILVVATLTKFTHGAWIVIILIPLLVVMFSMVHRHYERVAVQLRIEPGQLPPTTVKQFVLVPIDTVTYASLRALSFARSMKEQIIAVHVNTDTERAQETKEKMAQYAPDISFITLDSPYRQFVRPMVAYVEALHKQNPDVFVTIILPEFIPAHFWERALHGRTAQRLRAAFETHPNVAVVMVPYLLDS